MNTKNSKHTKKQLNEDKIVIGRHPEGITLNPMEYLLNEDKSLMTFDSIKQAKQHLRQQGIRNFKGLHFLTLAEAKML